MANEQDRIKMQPMQDRDRGYEFEIFDQRKEGMKIISASAWIQGPEEDWRALIGQSTDGKFQYGIDRNTGNTETTKIEWSLPFKSQELAETFLQRHVDHLNEQSQEISL